MYVVIDNFFDNPELEREKALEAQYIDVGHDGFIYPGLSLTEDPASVNKIKEALQADAPKQVTVTYRQYTPEIENKQATFIHNDSNIGTISAIAFLAHHKDSGLAFWRHKETGWVGQPTVEELGNYKDSPDLWIRIHEEGKDPSKWELLEVVPMKFNRCVAFLSKNYHSRWPREPIGQSIEDSRLIKVFFYKL